MSVIRVEVKVDGKLVEVFEKDLSTERDVVSALHSFSRGLVSHITKNWSFFHLFHNSKGI